MPFAALLASAIVGFLAQACVSLVGRVLVALGIGFVSFTGISLMLDGMRRCSCSTWVALDCCLGMWSASLAC